MSTMLAACVDIVLTTLTIIGHCQCSITYYLMEVTGLSQGGVIFVLTLPGIIGVLATHIELRKKRKKN